MAALQQVWMNSFVVCFTILGEGCPQVVVDMLWLTGKLLVEDGDRISVSNTAGKTTIFPNNTPGEEKINTFLLYQPGCYLFLAGCFMTVKE